MSQQLVEGKEQEYIVLKEDLRRKEALLSELPEFSISVIVNF
jgi:hypothetical protein